MLYFRTGRHTFVISTITESKAAIFVLLQTFLLQNINGKKASYFCERKQRQRDQSVRR